MTYKTIVRAICLLLAFTFLLPLMMTFASSFMSAEELSVVFKPGHAFRWIPYHVTAESYWKLLFESETYLATFWNSMFIALVSTGLQVLVALFAGYSLVRARFRGKGLLYFFYIMVMLTPFQVTLLPNYIFSKEIGLHNTWWALILPNAFAPMGVFLMRQFIHEIPEDIIQAAHMDTSSNLRVLFSIIAPNVRAGILTVAVLSFAESWNMVEQPLIFIEDDWLYPLSVRLNALSDKTLDMRFSGAVLFMIPTILLYLLFESELIEGVQHMKL